MGRRPREVVRLREQGRPRVGRPRGQGRRRVRVLLLGLLVAATSGCSAGRTGERSAGAGAVQSASPGPTTARPDSSRARTARPDSPRPSTARSDSPRPASPRPPDPGPPAAGAALPLPAGLQTAVVVRHVDGDTLVLRGTGPGPLPPADTRVRLLQIDTPEVFETRECYGEQASARTRALVPVGAGVSVQADERLTDRFGRTLLLVWDAQGRSVQETLVREGFATVLRVAPNDRGVAALREVEAQARRTPVGLWRDC